jgi:iron complex outermembrane receptor protein
MEGLLDDMCSARASRVKLRKATLLATCVATIGWTLPAHAAGNEDALAAAAIGEIVVTASRRAETVHDLPASISALGGKELKALGVVSSTDIASKVPNVEFRSAWGFSQPQYYIRGLGNRNFQTNAASPVAVYTDGIVMGSSLSQSFQALDLERVEVLRGPQGTLYGRNASAGLLNFISVKPNPDAGITGYVNATYGRFNELAGETALNVPLSDTVAARGAVSYRQRDGFFKDGGGNLGRKVGDEQTFQYRFTIGYFTDDLEITARARGGSIDNDQRPFKQIGKSGPAPFCPHLGLNQVCTDLTGFSDSSDPFESFLSFIGYEKGKANGGDIQVKYELTPSIGLYYSFAYDEASNHRFVDEDFSDNESFSTTYDTTVKFSSHELRLQSEDKSPFQWIFGVYHYRESLDQWYGGVLPLLNVSLGVPVAQQTRTAAAFVNAEWKFADKLSLRGGLRMTYDKRRGRSRSFVFDGTNQNFNPVPADLGSMLAVFEFYPITSIQKSWTKPSGEITLSYKPNADWHLYANYSVGFKGGDFNAGLFSLAENVIVDPEYVHNAEIGVKGRILDGRVSGELSLFRMNVSNQQVASIQSTNGIPSLILGNAGSTRVKGVELSLDARVAGGFSLRGSLGLLDAKFTSYPNGPGGADLSGNRLAYAPKVTANAAVKYDLSTAVGDFTVQGSWRYTGKMFDQPTNDPFYVVKSYWTADAFVEYRPSGDAGLSAKLWVRNLTDKHYYSTYFSSGGLGYEGLGFADPRTFGITLSYNFD